MASVIIPEILGGYKVVWNKRGEVPFERRLSGIHRNEVIIAKGNFFEGIEAKS